MLRETTTEFPMAELSYALNEDRGCLALEGAEARPFLQGLISNDVTRVTAAQAVYAALLTPQGRFLHDMFLAEAPGAEGSSPALWLDGEAARLDDLKKRLGLYKLRAKVTIADARDSLVVAVLWGRDALRALGLPAEPGRARRLAGGAAFVDPRLAALGARAILPRLDAAAAIGALGFAAAPLASHHRLRMARGVPEGSRDMPPDRALLLESGFEELHGVDFAKGCYIGQEVTARMKYRSLVKKRLVPVAIDGPPPAPGAPVMLGDQEAGEMRSCIDEVGLALLRLDLVEEATRTGTPLVAGAARLVPRRPDGQAA